MLIVGMLLAIACFASGLYFGRHYVKAAVQPIASAVQALRPERKSPTVHVVFMDVNEQKVVERVDLDVRLRKPWLLRNGSPYICAGETGGAYIYRRHA